jgi:hypothetical protein
VVLSTCTGLQPFISDGAEGLRWLLEDPSQRMWDAQPPSRDRVKDACT